MCRPKGRGCVHRRPRATRRPPPHKASSSGPSPRTSSRHPSAPTKSMSTFISSWSSLHAAMRFSAARSLTTRYRAGLQCARSKVMSGTALTSATGSNCMRKARVPTSAGAPVGASGGANSVKRPGPWSVRRTTRPMSSSMNHPGHSVPETTCEVMRPRAPSPSSTARAPTSSTAVNTARWLAGHEHIIALRKARRFTTATVSRGRSAADTRASTRHERSPTVSRTTPAASPRGRRRVTRSASICARMRRILSTCCPCSMVERRPWRSRSKCISVAARKASSRMTGAWLARPPKPSTGTPQTVSATTRRRSSMYARRARSWSSVWRSWRPAS
mmetsp:Transcript_21367/g.71881  ORF Transcript_21367/g.71881 Transcript_21367/m.71881 type:complete len:331 (+) Transcript_21367:425-1417(+)